MDDVDRHRMYYDLDTIDALHGYAFSCRGCGVLVKDVDLHAKYCPALVKEEVKVKPKEGVITSYFFTDYKC